jgi:hypothetical protein
MVWFLLMETKTVPVGCARRGLAMTPAAQSAISRYCRRGLPMRRNVSAELADSQHLHNQANGGKNAHHHDSET